MAKGSWWAVNDKTGEIITNPIGLIKGGAFQFPQDHLLIDFGKCAGSWDIVWRDQNFYHYTLPSKDSAGVTQLGMSAQVSQSLVNIFKKKEKTDLNNSNLYVGDDEYISEIMK